MVRRSLRLSLRLVAWLVASLAILAAVVAWRLSAGPVAIDLLVPYLEQALTPADGEVETTLDGALVRLGEDGAPTLAGTGFRITDASGAVVIELPEIEVAFSSRALLLHQVLAPVRFQVMAPEIVLTRRPDGSIGLRGTAAAEGREMNLALLAGPILAEPDPAEPLSYLQSVRIDGASLLLEDEASGSEVRASRGELVLTRDTDRLAGRVDLTLERPDHDVHLAGRFRLHQDRSGAFASAVVRGVRPADLRLLEDFIAEPARRQLAALPLEGAAVDLTVRVAGELDRAGLTHGLEVSLAGDGGRIDLPTELARPLDLARLRLQGRFLPDEPALDVRSLEVVVNGARVSGQGRLAFTDAGPEIAAELTAADVAAGELAALWPVRVGDDAREWVTENITAGTATAGEVRIDLLPSDIGTRPVRKEAVTGWFAYDDLTIRYFEELPPVTGVDGRATFDAQTMTFTPDAGAVGALQLSEGSIQITGMGIKGRDTTQLEVRAVIEGPVDEALALLDHEPFGFASELGLDPEAASGTTRTDLRIGLPLYKEVNEDDVRVTANATLGGIAIDGLLDRVDLTGGDFALEVDRADLVLTGRASLNGTAAEVLWEEEFERGTAPARRLVLEGIVDRAALASLGIGELPVEFEGGIRSEVEVVEGAGRLEVTGAFDLSPARLAYAPLGWRKPVGEPGTLSVRLTRQGEGPVVIEELELAAAEVDLGMSGRVTLDPFAVASLEVRRLTFREQRLSATLERGPEGAMEIDVAARVLDLEPFLPDDAAVRAADGDGEPELATPLRLTVRADRLILAEDAPPLADLDGVLVRDRRGWREVEMLAVLQGGVPVRLELSPSGGGARLSLTTDDAGALLVSLGFKRRIEGGRLRVEAEMADRRRLLDAAGRIRLESFTLFDAPVITRLLSVASLQGIGDLLQGDGLFVDLLDLPFSLADDVLSLGEGRLAGSQVGLTVKGDVDFGRERLALTGTVVPLYALNRAIGRIPIIGDFLAGSGDAAFAASYAVRGPFTDPDITVNPLTVLAPGFVRELFSGIRQGTLEPPVLPEDRD